MRAFLDLPINDEPAAVKAARKSLDDTAERQAALGFALAEARCSYEARHILWPIRKHWKPDATAAVEACFEAQSWWKKNWRAFAQASQAKRVDGALEMLGDHVEWFWDMPPALMHLSNFAMYKEDLDLAEHILRRIVVLTDHGLPKMPMEAFAYVSRAALIDVLAARGAPEAALDEYEHLTPNPGNAMAHEMLGARLMALAGEETRAMEVIADMLVTAMTKRSGYSRDMRIDFVERDPDIAVLRKRKDWVAMLDDPKAWRASA